MLVSFSDANGGVSSVESLSLAFWKGWMCIFHCYERANDTCFHSNHDCIHYRKVLVFCTNPLDNEIKRLLFHRGMFPEVWVIVKTSADNVISQIFDIFTNELSLFSNQLTLLRHRNSIELKIDSIHW